MDFSFILDPALQQLPDDKKQEAIFQGIDAQVAVANDIPDDQKDALRTNSLDYANKLLEQQKPPVVDLVAQQKDAEFQKASEVFRAGPSDILSEVVNGFKRGTIAVPKMLGNALQYVSDKGGSLETMGKDMSAWADEVTRSHPEIVQTRESEEAPIWSPKSFLPALASLAPTLIGAGVIETATAGAATPVLGAAAAAGAVGTGATMAIFGLSAAFDVKQAALEKGLTPEKASECAGIAGVIVAVTIPVLKLWKGGEAVIKGAILKGLTESSTPSQLAISAFKSIAKSGVEFGAINASTAEVTNLYDVTDENIAKEFAKGVIQGAALRTLMMVPTIPITEKAKANTLNALTDISDPTATAKAIDKVYGIAKQLDPKWAEEFKTTAYQQVADGKPVSINDAVYNDVGRYPALSGHPDDQPVTPGETPPEQPPPSRPRTDSEEIQAQNMRELEAGRPGILPETPQNYPGPEAINTWLRDLKTSEQGQFNLKNEDAQFAKMAGEPVDVTPIHAAQSVDDAIKAFEDITSRPVVRAPDLVATEAAQAVNAREAAEGRAPAFAFSTQPSDMNEWIRSLTEANQRLPEKDLEASRTQELAKQAELDQQLSAKPDEVQAEKAWQQKSEMTDYTKYEPKPDLTTEENKEFEQWKLKSESPDYSMGPVTDYEKAQRFLQPDSYKQWIADVEKAKEGLAEKDQAAAREKAFAEQADVASKLDAVKEEPKPPEPETAESFEAEKKAFEQKAKDASYENAPTPDTEQEQMDKWKIKAQEPTKAEPEPKSLEKIDASKLPEDATVEVSRILNNGKVEKVNVSAKDAHAELKDTQTTIDRLKGLLDTCL